MYSVPVCATNIMMVSTNNNTTLKSIVERVYLSNGVIMCGKMGKRKTILFIGNKSFADFVPVGRSLLGCRKYNGSSRERTPSGQDQGVRYN